MDPNNSQPVNQPAPGPVGNGQQFSQAPVQPVAASQFGQKKKSNKKPLIFGLIGLAVVAAVAVAVVFIIKNNSVPPINFEEDNKLTIYSERASKVDPTNYELSEQDNDEAEEKAEQLLDAVEMDTDELLSYFKKKIQGELDKNNTDGALKLLWKERDILQERGFNDMVQKVLLEMDTSKLVNFQKIYLYRAIVTASVMVGDQDTMSKYSALVNELDPSDQYIYPVNGIEEDVVEDECAEGDYCEGEDHF